MLPPYLFVYQIIRQYLTSNICSYSLLFRDYLGVGVHCIAYAMVGSVFIIQNPNPWIFLYLIQLLNDKRRKYKQGEHHKILIILAILIKILKMPKKVKAKICFECNKLAKVPNQFIYGVRLCQACQKIRHIIYDMCKTHNLPIIFVSLETYDQGCQRCMQAIKTEKFPQKITIRQATKTVKKKRDQFYLEYINRAFFMLSDDYERFMKCFKNVFEEQYQKKREETFDLLDQFFKEEKQFAEKLQNQNGMICKGTTFEGTSRVNQMIKSFKMAAQNHRMNQIEDKRIQYRQFLSKEKQESEVEYPQHRKIIKSTCRFKTLYHSGLKYFPAQTPFIDEQYQLISDQLRDQIDTVAKSFITVEQKAKLKKSMKELQTKHKGEMDNLKSTVDKLTVKLERAERIIAGLEQIEYKHDILVEETKELNITIKQKNIQLESKNEQIKILNQQINCLKQSIKQNEDRHSEQCKKMEQKLEKASVQNRNLQLRMKEMKEQVKEWDKVKQRQLLRKNQNRGLCKICLDRMATYVNIGCGHINICDECVKQPKFKSCCIICRKQGEYIPVFSSLIYED